MLHIFSGNNIPFGLTQSLGRLYGTIFLGGGGGQVYSLSLSGKKTVIFTPHHTTGRPAEFLGVTAPGGPLIVTSVEGGICTGGDTAPYSPWTRATPLSVSCTVSAATAMVSTPSAPSSA